MLSFRVGEAAHRTGARMRFALTTRLAALAVPASAADLPQYDVSGHCGRIAVAAGAGARAAEMREACERREQAAHMALTHDWPLVSREVQGRCLHMAHLRGASYVLLHDCVALELAADER